MAGICVWITLSVLVATLSSLCLAENEAWPNFGCHPFNATSSHRSAFYYRQRLHTSCLEPYQKWNGMCPKVCVLFSGEILVRVAVDKPLLFKTDVFIHQFRKELGYNERDTPPPATMKIVNKVRSELEGCLKTYPEFAHLDPTKVHSCDPWSNLTTCIDKAVVIILDTTKRNQY